MSARGCVNAIRELVAAKLLVTASRIWPSDGIRDAAVRGSIAAALNVARLPAGNLRVSVEGKDNIVRTVRHTEADGWSITRENAS